VRFEDLIEQHHEKFRLSLENLGQEPARGVMLEKET
jgi:hypothetical protein